MAPLSLRYRLFEKGLRACRRELDVTKWVLPMRAGALYVPNMNRGYSTAKGVFAYGRTTRGGVRCLEIGTERQESNGVVVYVHGGGYVVGNPSMVKSIASLLSYYTDMKVVCPAYRLAPEAPLPAATEDIAAVCADLVDSGTVPQGLLSVVGDSAGGGLSLLTLQHMAGSGQSPACGVLVSPWTDLGSSSGSHEQNWDADALLGGQKHESFKIVADMVVGNRDIKGRRKPHCHHDVRSGEYSPLYGEFKGLPPLYFQVGSTEVLLDDSVRAHKEAQACGVDTRLDIREGMCHSFPIFSPLFPEADEGVKDIADFILSRTLCLKNPSRHPRCTAGLADCGMQACSTAQPPDGGVGSP
eukprot:Rhum_TRINITY_DN13566_c0_g1::Rhum_TRINITY_DN13566_c0_g1_i1::g.61341::m.61341/K14731/mlhB, chnC; epsilon-lactone hydrolase